MITCRWIGRQRRTISTGFSKGCPKKKTSLERSRIRTRCFVPACDGLLIRDHQKGRIMRHSIKRADFKTMLKGEMKAGNNGVDLSRNPSRNMRAHLRHS